MSPLDLVHKLYEERDCLREAERGLSNAYVRLRSILGAFDTPHGPTPEQIWAHTEAKALQLRADRDRLRAALAELLLSPLATAAHGRGYDLRQVEHAAWSAAQAALAATEKP